MNKLAKHIIESRFNFNIDQLDIEDIESEFTLSKQQYKSKSMRQEYLENNLFVDLGLPSGTLWCNKNLGASNGSNAKSWYGNSYAWGEVDPKKEFNWVNYKLGNGKNYTDKFGITKYGSFDDQLQWWKGQSRYDGKSQLETCDDAAKQIDPSWSIPTFDQFYELFFYDYTKIKLKKNYLGIKDLNGLLITSNLNDNFIFFPFAGHYEFSSHKKLVKQEGMYWTSSKYITDDTFVPPSAYIMHMYDASNKYKGKITHCNRIYGLSIRPVMKK